MYSLPQHGSRCLVTSSIASTTFITQALDGTALCKRRADAGWARSAGLVGGEGGRYSAIASAAQLPMILTMESMSREWFRR